MRPTPLPALFGGYLVCVCGGGGGFGGFAFAGVSGWGLGAVTEGNDHNGDDYYLVWFAAASTCTVVLVVLVFARSIVR